MDPTLDVAVAPDAAAVPATRPLTPLDRRVLRLLRLPDGPPTATERSARKVFETSIYLSAARCLLTYIVLPFVFPIIGVSASATPVIGLPISAIAIVANVASIRRFWRADHKYKWHYTALAGAIILAMTVLVVGDVIDLTS